jgi:restriction endonuclease S subunit
MQLLEDGMNGTTLKHLNKSFLEEFEIPLPSLERQAQIVDAIDGWASLAQQEEVALKILEKQMMFQVKEMGRGQVRVKLGDIVKPSSMKHHSTTDGNKTGKYPLISSALKVEYYMDTYDSEIPSLIFNTINADGNCSVHYYEKFNVSSNTYVLSASNKITLQFIYYYLKTESDLLKSCFEGTTKKALARPLLQSIEIPLPSLTEQQTLQSDFDEIRHKHAKIAEYKGKAQAAIQRLIPGAAKKEDEPEVEAEPEAEQEEAEPVSTTPSATLSHESPIPLTKPDYNAMSKPELLEQCKNNNIKGVSNKKKEELIKLLEAL